jgi:hypothetical protein
VALGPTWNVQPKGTPVMCGFCGGCAGLSLKAYPEGHSGSRRMVSRHLMLPEEDVTLGVARTEGAGFSHNFFLFGRPDLNSARPFAPLRGHHGCRPARSKCPTLSITSHLARCFHAYTPPLHEVIDPVCE